MKQAIHPDYKQVAFYDVSVDKYFIVGSTLKTSKTVEIDGVTYPYMALDVSSESHPFYTGKQKTAKSDGRVAQFNRRFAPLNNKKKA